MRFCAIIVALIVGGSCAAQEFVALDLLNQRLEISLPAGAESQARGHNIMGAPEPDENETRLVYQEDDKKLVVMGWELFIRAGSDFEQRVDDELLQISQEEKTEFVPTQIAPGVRAGIPTELNSDNDAILYAIAFVHHRDGTVQRLGIFFNKAFHADVARCRQLTDTVLRSIVIGSRELQLTAGDRSMELSSKTTQLVVTVPDYWTVNTQRGVDFLVHRMQRVSLWGEPSENISIYLGGYPSYHHSRYPPEEIELTEMTSELFGEKPQWFEFSPPGAPNWKILETISSVPGASDYLQAHVFMGASSDERMEGLRQIIASARVESQ